MAKPSTHKLLLEQGEFWYLQSSVPRNLKYLKGVKEREPKNKLITARFIKSLEDLAEKVALPPEVDIYGSLILKTNRQDLRLLHDLCVQEHAAVVTKVIPGYQDKMTKEGRERIEPYLDAAVEKSKIILAVLNKVKARLA